MKKPPLLSAFNEVVLALGGVTAVARLLERSPGTVCNWRTRGYFPPKFYFKMTEELAKHGYTATRSLWRFETERRAA